MPRARSFLRGLAWRSPSSAPHPAQIGRRRLPVHEGAYRWMYARVAQDLRRAVRDRGLRLGVEEYTVIANVEEARQLVADHDDQPRPVSGSVIYAPRTLNRPADASLFIPCAALECAVPA